MKKLLFCGAILALTFTSCENDQSTNNLPEAAVEVDMSDFYVYTDDSESKATQESKHGDKCHSMQVLNRQLRENPGLEKKMYNIELHTRKAINAKKPDGTPGGGNNGGGGDPEPDPVYTGAVTIPVVVNILEDPAHPVTTAHINSQIAILTADFNDNNPNRDNVPNEFVSLRANSNITFTLHDVVRKSSNGRTSWGTNNAMKDPSQGGIAATDSSTYLNLWVCEIGGGILGYTKFPGGSAATDGVVIGSDFFGENAAGGVYGHGRTATHEVGHWLNLRHIWGDGRCKQDDFVADTPSSDGPNYACPTYPTVNCRSNDMTMNYMDYVYDDCMYMFTLGQNDRMRALFTTGGAKVSFVN